MQLYFLFFLAKAQAITTTLLLTVKFLELEGLLVGRSHGDRTINLRLRLLLIMAIDFDQGKLDVLAQIVLQENSIARIHLLFILIRIYIHLRQLC